MNETATTAAAQKFCDQWSTSFVAVLESLGAAGVTAAWSVPLAPALPGAPGAPDTAVPDTSLASSFQVRGALQGSLTLLCDESVAVQFAQLLQPEAPDPSVEFSAMQRDAFAEFLRTVAAALATAWKAQTSQQIELLLENVALEPVAGAQGATLHLKSDKFAALALQLVLDPALCSALDAAAGGGAEGADPLAAYLLAGPTPNLALLLDVELEATIRFGQRDMLLREVFALVPGAVIELNQLVNEPAELLVAGRLIARGEVVVVDGNFGLRVTEVAATSQRAALMELS
jgi:flagellar motor switch protein FliN/FliY